ncbi:putative kinesin [Trypanosoma rangeli]|uniref:Putative kinesin n=1 Tax=Trypanosoma rangeli TaxID=5698 RepID=A0A3R7LLF2_TRYRA|nr:putative kinesin [Trypanosoma rangeli]RNE99443.1 putative kinesin [Trypanosoma rangeli]|eukprot:RNE99443.1 putative kinesin [Trypanosoma rangeli]
MYADDAGGGALLDEPSGFAGERSGVLSSPNKAHLTSRRRVVLPVVHIRVRPILPYLGERKEHRHVWCLDHQNIVVRSSKVASARRHTASPVYGHGEPNSAPQSPFISSLMYHDSPSPVRWGELQCHNTPFGKQTPRKHRRDVSCPRRTSTATPRRGPRPPTPTTQGTVSPNPPGHIRREEHFSFDFIHGEDANQDEVFEESVLDFVDMALLAQSVAIVCYGPTGSGKTHSMMGPTRSPVLKKRGPIIPALHNTSLFKNRQLIDSCGRSRIGTAHERLSNSRRSSSITSTTNTSESAVLASTTMVLTEAPAPVTTTPPAVERDEAKQQQQEEEQEQKGWQSPGHGIGLREIVGSSLSSGASPFDLEFPQYIDTNAATRNEMSLTGLSSGLADSLLVADEVNESVGLLPRLVLILLERRGETIVLEQEEPSVKASSGARPSSGRDRNQDRQRRGCGASLTLRGLTLYGVELYMDEFHDLLDPGKRVIPNVGDIGGLDAFCQKMNNPSAFAASSGGKRFNGGGGGAGSSPFRGGGVAVSSVDDFHRCYKLASRNRVTKGHQRNDTSSRSHAVFILQLQFDLADLRQAGGEAVMQSVYSYVAMVDLAGSERVKETKVEGAALREAQCINKSLSALSAVILALYRRSSHVPYRDSKLTRLLRPCLESGHVLILVHATPCSAEETLRSLKFAEQVRHTNVQTHSMLNATPEVVLLLEDLRDPHAEGHMEAYRRTEVEYAQLCAEMRLAYLSRDAHDLSQQEFLSPAANPAGTRSPGRELSPCERRRLVIETLVERQLHRYRAMEDKRLQEAAAEIEREWNFYVESARRSKEQDIENLRASIEQLEALNARLAVENSQPVLRDEHAMAIKQRMKELAAEMTNYAREKLLLREGMRAINQRLSLQTDLERCLDEQLQKAQRVGAEGGGSSARLSVDGHMDREMGEIFHQQHLLSKEMSLLRKETTCFVRGDGIWEGLWARVMRQELLLAISIDLEMLEGILLRPQSLCWVLEANGLTSEAARDAAFPTYSVARNVKTLLDTFETLKKQAASHTNRDGETEARKVPLPPIPLALSSGDEVRSAATLIGCYGDEAKMQEVGVKRLEEGIFCEVTCLTMGAEELVRRRLPATGLMQLTNYKAPWGCLRLVHPPKDTSSYSLEFFQRTYAGSDKVRDRRVISIPLAEPQLHLKLHVFEADGLVRTSAWDDASLAPVSALPLLALELQGVRPAPNTGTQQYQDVGTRTRSRGHAPYNPPPAIDTGGAHNNHGLLPSEAEKAHPHDVLLTKRLDCGGELLLPSSCMAACEEGKGCFLLHFPERLFAKATRTEAVECIVAALSGLTLPLFSAASQDCSSSNTEADTVIGDVRVLTYQQVPYVLLSSDGGPLRSGGRATSLLVPRMVGMQLLGYFSATQIRFYFQMDDDSRTEANSETMLPSQPFSHGRFAGPFSTACAMLSRLGALALAPSASGGGGKDGDAKHGDSNAKSTGNLDGAASMVRHMQQLFAFRKKTRARVRQQIFDAEDIKAELLYSYSDSELLHGSHIKDVLKEARDLIGLQRPRNSTSFVLRGPVRATPGLCREICGTTVPWTLWHWAHRWKALQKAHRLHQSLTGAYDMDGDADSTDDSEDGGDRPFNMASTATRRSAAGQSLVVFEELPCFLTCME